jgi:hypothetical protein
MISVVVADRIHRGGLETGELLASRQDRWIEAGKW